MQFQHISRGFFLEACWGNCSVTKLHLTLCDPLDCSTPGFPALHHLLEFAQTHVHWVGDALKPSRPLSFPSLALSLSQRESFQMSWFFMSGSQNIGASASVLPVHVQGWFPLGLLWSPCCRVYHLKSVGTLLQVVGFESTGGAAPNLGILILIPRGKKSKPEGSRNQTTLEMETGSWEAEGKEMGVRWGNPVWRTTSRHNNRSSPPPKIIIVGIEFIWFFGEKEQSGSQEAKLQFCWNIFFYDE